MVHNSTIDVYTSAECPSSSFRRVRAICHDIGRRGLNAHYDAHLSVGPGALPQ